MEDSGSSRDNYFMRNALNISLNCIDDVSISKVTG